jgi:hypothetical protein
MQYPVPAYTSFTIPTGATSGARITFNENGNGEILVYNASGVVVDSIGGNNGAIISYSTGPNASVEIVNGGIFFGGAPGFTGAASIMSDNTTGGSLSVDSGVGALFPYADSANFTLVGGTNSAAPGGTGPHATLVDDNASSQVDLRLSGAVVKTDLSGNMVTWQTPTMQTGWATGTGVGGNYPPLQWRLDAENNVHIHGTFHATAATPATPIASGFPLISGTNVGVAGATPLITSNSFSLAVYLSDTGVLDATSTTGIANTNTFIINAKIPLGNLS